jgi:hypothetical protein
MDNKTKQPTASNPLEHVVMWIDPSEELPPLGELVIVRKKPTGNVIAFDNITDHGGWLHNSYMADRS